MDFSTFTINESRPLPPGVWHNNTAAKEIYSLCSEFCKDQPDDSRYQFQLDTDPQNNTKASLTRIK
jgi:hypothetical protein